MFSGYVGLVVSRFITCFYYYNNDDYPWYPSPIIALDSEYLKASSKFTKHYPKFLFVSLLILFMFDIMDLITP